MSDELDLFAAAKAALEEQLVRPLARNTDPDTSHSAARRMLVTGTAATHRKRIVQLLNAFPNETWTYDRIDRSLGWRDASAARRLTELVRLGFVQKTGTGTTLSGSPAAVYGVTDEGRAWLLAA